MTTKVTDIFICQESGVIYCEICDHHLRQLICKRGGMHKKNDLLFVCTLVCTHSQIPNKHSGPNKWIKLSISLNTINGQALINEKGGCFCVEKSFNTCE